MSVSINLALYIAKYLSHEDVDAISQIGLNKSSVSILGHLLVLKRKNKYWKQRFKLIYPGGYTNPHDLKWKYLFDNVRLFTAGRKFNSNVTNTFRNVGKYLFKKTDGQDHGEIAEFPFDDVTQISCGKDFQMFTTPDKRILASGGNLEGQLGLKNTRAHVNHPTKINMHNVVEVKCGYHYTIIRTSNNEAFACGNNNFGALGLGSTSEVINNFMKIPIDGVVKIITGRFHTMLITLDGSVLSCGRNYESQLGLGSSANVSTFSRVSINNVAQISCGSDYTLFLTYNGQALVCGSDNSGALGLGGNYKVSSPTYIDINDVTQISAGFSHSMFLTSKNKVFACGYNKMGQLGLGHNDKVNNPTKVSIDNVVQVSCGTFLTIFLTSDNKVFSCGNYLSEFCNNKFPPSVCGTCNSGSERKSKPPNVNIPTEIKIDNVVGIYCTFDVTCFLRIDL